MTVVAIIAIINCHQGDNGNAHELRIFQINRTIVLQQVIVALARSTYQLEELQNSRKALQVSRVEYNVRRVGGAGGGACYGHGVRHLGGVLIGGSGG